MNDEYMNKLITLTHKCVPIRVGIEKIQQTEDDPLLEEIKQHLNMAIKKMENLFYESI